MTNQTAKILFILLYKFLFATSLFAQCVPYYKVTDMFDNLIEKSTTDQIKTLSEGGYILTDTLYNRLTFCNCRDSQSNLCINKIVIWENFIEFYTTKWDDYIDEKLNITSNSSWQKQNTDLAEIYISNHEKVSFYELEIESVKFYLIRVSLL